MYNNGVAAPSSPVRLMLGVPGKTFEEKKKNALMLVNFLSFAFVVTSIILMLIVPIRTRFSCTHDIDSYDCQVRSSSILRTLDSANFEKVTHAIVGTQYSQDRQIYQIQFIDLNNNKLQYNTYLDDTNIPVHKQVADINKLFSRSKNFNYSLWGSMLVILSIFIFLFAGVGVFLKFHDLLNNYVYIESSPNQYEAILQGKGLGNMSPSSAVGLMGHFGREQKQPVYNIPLGPKAKHQGPRAEELEIAKGLQDDELTDIQKEFYDRNN